MVKLRQRLHDLLRRFALWLLDWVDACPICGAPWAEHRCPYQVSASVSMRACDICQQPLPVDAIRTHDGKWRCAKHKAAA